MRLNKLFLRFSSILMVALFAACGSENGDQITNDLGPTGGTVISIDEMASVSVPRGALSQKTAITVGMVFSPVSGNIGRAYEFGPKGTSFSKPVTISITYDETIIPKGTQESNLKLAKFVNNHWQIDSSSLVDMEKNIVIGTTTSFSIYSVVDSSTSLNSMPIADAGNNQNVTVGSLVTLDGTNSSDVDGDQVTYNWTIIMTPQGSLASLSDSASANPTFTADIKGIYVVSLIVNDGTVKSDPDSVTITVAITITTVDSGRFVGENPSIAIGADGFPVISYYDSTNGDLIMAHCGDVTCTSNNTLTIVDSVGFVGENPSIAIGVDDGLPVISYYDSTNGDLKVAHCGKPDCSSGNTLTTVDSTGSVGENSSIAIGADKLPVISYYDFTNGNLKVIHCGNVDCSSGNDLTTVVSNGSVGVNFSLAIGGDGLPVISYYDKVSSALKVAHCGNADCTSGNTLTFMHSAGVVGENSSIAIGGNGFPVISYVDFTLDILNVAHCGNETCTSKTLTTVDSTGENPSIAIGVDDGLPVISYYDFTNGVLKVAHCGNATCTSGNTLTVVDSEGNVGFFSSIAIGSDGFPVITYLDVTNGSNLKVAHCGNVQCTP